MAWQQPIDRIIGLSITNQIADGVWGLPLTAVSERAKRDGTCLIQHTNGCQNYVPVTIIEEGGAVYLTYAGDETMLEMML